MKIYIFVFLLIFVIGCSKKIDRIQKTKNTIIGQIFVHYKGGEPPDVKDYTRFVKKSNCIRFYNEVNFDSKTPFKEITTDGFGKYEISTYEDSCAIVLIRCAKQLQIVDKTRDMLYEKYHIVNFEKNYNDTIYFIDTLFYQLPE